MSVKSQFLQKLRARQAAPAPAVSKTQADIAEFCLRMTQLQAQMDEWLMDTGLNVETFTVSVTDLLVEGGAFDMAALVLRIDARSVKFVPVFLYGQGGDRVRGDHLPSWNTHDFTGAFIYAVRYCE